MVVCWYASMLVCLQKCKSYLFKLTTMKRNVPYQVISVSHHPATARNASHILVLDKGRLVEVGTWNELMKLQNGNFKKLVDAQREG